MSARSWSEPLKPSAARSHSEPQSGRRAGSARAGDRSGDSQVGPIGTDEAHRPQNKAGWAARRPASRTATGDHRLPAAAALMVFASGSPTARQRAL
jgi:hypothetical protein